MSLVDIVIERSSFSNDDKGFGLPFSRIEGTDLAETVHLDEFPNNGSIRFGSGLEQVGLGGNYSKILRCEVEEDRFNYEEGFSLSSISKTLCDPPIFSCPKQKVTNISQLMALEFPNFFYRHFLRSVQKFIGLVSRQ